MTGPCSGSVVGVAKPGFSALQYLTPAAIGGALAGLSGWSGAGVGAVIGAITYDLSVLCPNGPPPQPTFTVTDIVSLLGGPLFPDYVSAALKFHDFLEGVFWPILCQCPSGTVTAPAPSTYPTGGPQSDGTPPANVVPCAKFVGGPRNFVGGAVDTPLVATATASLAGSTGIPAGSTWFRVTYTNAVAGGVNHLSHFITRFWSQAGANLGGDGTDVVSGVTTTKIIAVPAGAVAVQVIVQDPFTPPDSTNLESVTLELFCGASPTQTQAPCCPPDETLVAMVTQILSNIQLIQKQLVPFGYIPGTVHTGLSGAGVLSISGLLGAKVEVTALPAQLGVAGTTPPEYFDMGFITFGTADGYPQSVRLERSTQLILPARASAYTDLAYDLHPGVVVTITELEREP